MSARVCACVSLPHKIINKKSYKIEEGRMEIKEESERKWKKKQPEHNRKYCYEKRVYIYRYGRQHCYFECTFLH